MGWWLSWLNEAGTKVLQAVAQVSLAIQERLGRDEAWEEFRARPHPVDAYTFGPMKMTDERRAVIERPGQGNRVDARV
jgi:hypothetical protein